MRTIAVLSAACVLVAGAAQSLPTLAADLALPFAPPPVGDLEPEAPFEFGTGWYLRGDASFADAVRPTLNFSASSFSDRKQDWNYVLGGGIGYKFNDFLRGDVTGDWFETTNYTPPAPNAPSGLVGRPFNKARVQKYDGLANLYVDLGSWYGITPYVGGGAGVAVFDPSETISTASRALDVAGGTSSYAADNLSSRTKFAWAAMAGVSYQLGANAAIDVGYRHLDLGRFATTLAGYAIDHHYTEDQVRVGLRYMIF